MSAQRALPRDQFQRTEIPRTGRVAQPFAFSGRLLSAASIFAPVSSAGGTAVATIEGKIAATKHDANGAVVHWCFAEANSAIRRVERMSGAEPYGRPQTCDYFTVHRAGAWPVVDEGAVRLAAAGFSLAGFFAFACCAIQLLT